jgi:hypothetical protein
MQRRKGWSLKVTKEQIYTHTIFKMTIALVNIYPHSHIKIPIRLDSNNYKILFLINTCLEVSGMVAS